MLHAHARATHVLTSRTWVFALALRARRLYWEDYATRAAALVKAYPDRVRVFASPDVFARGEAQRDMLRFAGFAEPRLRPGRAHNCMASCPPRAPPAADAVEAQRRASDAQARYAALGPRMRWPDGWPAARGDAQQA
jgi:hypothetical protein